VTGHLNTEETLKGKAEQAKARARARHARGLGAPRGAWPERRARPAGRGEEENHHCVIAAAARWRGCRRVHAPDLTCTCMCI